MALPHPSRLGNVAIDGAIVVAAWYAAFFFRFDQDITLRQENLRDTGVWFVLGAKLAVFLLFGLYQRWWRYVSLRDLVVVARATLAASVAAVLLVYVVRGQAELGFVEFPATLARGVIALDFAFTLLGLIGVRAAARSLFERPPPGFLVAHGREVLVIGAGDAGRIVVNEMLKKRRLGYTPVRILDDDLRNQGMRLDGVKVDGTIDDLASILRRTKINEVVIALPDIDPAKRQQIVAACRRHNVTVKTVPTVHEILDGDPSLLARLRPVQVEDVLGRKPVALDIAEVGGYLTGRRVLVTGAGGSIGSELVRQIARLHPAALVLVDHAENNLFEITQTLTERGVTGFTPVIADVKDVPRMERLLASVQPEIVFHAAAYKHVPMMEANPGEAIRNNALATRDLAHLAGRLGVERFVLVSTDKAVDAQTMMGASKALCEWVVEAVAQEVATTRYIAVRFGNVLGSSGSVIPIFRRQISEGGPVTVTDPEMTRYFMTIPEASQLIVQAGGVGRSGDIFVLDMGDPVRILDLAEDMVRLSGFEPVRDESEAGAGRILVRVVGRRPGEKLHEVLFDDDEMVERTHHEKLMRARRPRIDAAWLEARLAVLEEQLDAGRTDEATALVREMTSAPLRGEPAATS